MKKVVLLSSLFLLLQSGLRAQSAPITVTDTLHYFYNKQLFKVPNSNYYPSYKSPASTNTAITHVGSVFLNNDPNLIINGAMARASFGPYNNALMAPLTIYLFTVDVNLMPIEPALDSVTVYSGSAQAYTSNPSGVFIGGIFGGTVNPTPKNVPGNFAIMARNMSPFTGDSIYLYRTSSLTHTASGLNSTNNMGERLGVLRNAGIFRKTADYLDPEFGPETDYEFCMAPIVTYTLQANHLTPPKVNSQPVDSVFLWEGLTFTNTSTSHFTNRFFNLNQFYRHFWPYANTPPTGFSADSSIAWYFDDEPDPYSIIPLPINTTTVTKWYNQDTGGCYTNCEMRARLRKMTAGGSSVSYFANIQFSLCVKYPIPDGMDETPGLDLVKVFPNPGVQSRVTINGLKGKNSIYIYDLLGQLVEKHITNEGQVSIDLFHLAGGNYVFKIIDEHAHYKVVKFVHQRE